MSCSFAKALARSTFVSTTALIDTSFIFCRFLICTFSVIEPKPIKPILILSIVQSLSNLFLYEFLFHYLYSIVKCYLQKCNILSIILSIFSTYIWYLCLYILCLNFCLLLCFFFFIYIICSLVLCV